MQPTLLPALVLAFVLPANAGGKGIMLRQRAWGPGRPKPGEEQTEYFSGDRIVTVSPRVRGIVDLGGAGVERLSASLGMLKGPGVGLKAEIAKLNGLPLRTD